MAAGRLIIPGFQPATDANGDRIAGAKLYFYANGTVTLATVYTTAALTTELVNPVVADAAGNFPPMWADTASTFTVAGTDAASVPMFAYDGVSPSIDATLASVALAEAAKEGAVDAANRADAADTASSQNAAAALASATAAAASAATAVEIGGFDPSLYQLKSEKGQANGYVALDGDGLVPDAHLTGAPVSTDQQAALDLKLNITDGATKSFAIAAAIAL